MGIERWGAPSDDRFEARRGEEGQVEALVPCENQGCPALPMTAVCGL